MGFLDFLFGKTIIIDNPFFGKMIFIDFKKDSQQNYFECSRNFGPINDKIELSLNGGISSSTEKQKLFFQKIENNYAEIIASIAPIIENEFANWQEGFNIIDFEKEFNPVHLTIPKIDEKENVWEIVFESVHDLNHIFTITMKNFNAINVLIDG